ncbi:DNA replication and repair protein RecN [Natranaerovirga hydrolytica]|uniref:DNA repair protein RecN n=1 Tax=Natranaerovirga hydrolytica TaxID=680378 RepID=A0A4R1N5S3_9FIRM|nr:DNA repair protein RecN [Natranaerovirga hydrolytica]TCK98349.1 DNA replication and repair protein RecN [Natranaerovirga hydrolytica]
MLVHLHVKNLALIDEVEVDFIKGLNILTGETGAGKSIIIDSINSALGAKTSKEIIRTGCEYALIELLFIIEDISVIQVIKDLDIPIDENNEILITRRINLNGRSVFKINGESATALMVKNIASYLMDIHGQHEHQSLLHKNKHIEILDQFCGKQLNEKKTNLSQLYKAYTYIKNQLQEQSLSQEQKQREISFLEFEINEIETAQLKDNEDKAITDQYNKLSNAKEIVEVLNEVYELTGLDTHSNMSASNFIGKGSQLLGQIKKYDPILLSVKEQLENVDNLLNDVNREIVNYIEEMTFDEQEFVQLEERLNTINHLKSKYGDSISDIISYKTAAESKLEKLLDYEAYKNKLEQELANKEKIIQSICNEITQIRLKQSQKVAKDIKKALIDLNFIDVQFEVTIRQLENFNKNGWDDVEFMISTNPGEDIKPLSKVASGGELSRIMLAIKSILASADAIESLIFDEIDVGISGRTAQKVSEKLAVISKDHQVICITHLPQIAAMAEKHFLIEKRTDKKKTNTSIIPLKENEVIHELARLVSGVEITDTVLNSAKEMKQMASQVKAKLT